MEIYAGSTDSPNAWRNFLSRTGTDLVLVRTTGPFHDQLTEQARRGPGATWSEVYRDDAYALFARHELASRLPLTDRLGQPIPARFP